MKKKTALLLSLLLLFSLVLTACGSGKADHFTGESMDMIISPEAPQVAPMEPEVDADGFYSKDYSGSDVMVDSAIYNDPNAKVIRSAELTIQTLEFDQSVAKLAALTESMGGYYETAQIDAGGYYDRYASRSAYYIVRIPKANFVSFRDNVGEVGHLYSIVENSRNVGEEYYDTEARLATLETKQERLLALLEKADVMKDIIELESALANVQYEIDKYNTTLRKYDSLIDYSTFTVHLREVHKIEQEPGPQEGFGTRFLASLKDGLSEFCEGVQDFALWLARNIVALVIWAIVIVAVVKIILWRVKKRRSKKHQEE